MGASGTVTLSRILKSARIEAGVAVHAMYPRRPLWYLMCGLSPLTFSHPENTSKPSPMDVIDEAVKLNHALVNQPFATSNSTLKLRYDLLGYWHAVRNGEAAELRETPVLVEIDRNKPLIGVPMPLMKVAGFFAQQIGRFGLMPPITADQVELMGHDNVVRPGANTFATLGIEPVAPDAILPTYLDRFRLGGRYNQHAPA